MRLFTSDYILPVATEPIKNGIIAVDDRGQISGVHEAGYKPDGDYPVEKFHGIIVPGFVNSHCHLELSHLNNHIPEGEGLIPFIKGVISKRAFEEEVIEERMREADKAMWENGIVAVGDIANTAISKGVKQHSPVYYHTYIELLGFEPQKATEVFERGLQLKEHFSPLRASVTPHAPYSVCKELLRFINQSCTDNGEFLTIHNQESEEENKFYRYKSGAFLDFYQHLNINVDFFKPQARNSVQSVMPLFPQKVPVMLVHNTYTSLKDIYFVRRFAREITWCFCPNANLYIEKRLPKVEMFLFDDFNITLGTDSLASNRKLCILDELKVLHAHFPGLKLQDTIKWATLNGAKFMNIAGRFGSIETGKTPGLNLITHVEGLNLTKESQVKKLI